jgi:SAM-dependent methyltransferase
VSGFNVCIVRPPRYRPSEAFREVAEALHFALLRLGRRSVITENQWSDGRRPIVLAPHLLGPDAMGSLPADAVLYNFEQLTPELLERFPHYRHALQAFEVWDYAAENIERFVSLGLKGEPRLLPVAYVPEWTRIERAEAQDIDVLFYGSVNDRRREILQELGDAGLEVAVQLGVYGPHRDGLIARAKLVLNAHFHEAQVFEMPRVGYLLANGVPVVAELGARTRIDPALRDAVRAVPRAALADACVELAYDAAARAELGKRAFRSFSAMPLEPLLAPLVGASATTSDRVYPCALNVGSGKDWRADRLNLDIEPRWHPDVVLDLARPIAFPLEVDTERLGPVALCEGMYERISANDVLEHIPDLQAAMTNCLRLLKLGGELEVKVPYDLSYGAWQDPTHVRAFNERSFLYYTDWFWYLGWTDHRFDLVALDYGYSELGERLRAEGVEPAEIARTPRAVDELRVRLRKRGTTEDERADALARRGEARHRPGQPARSGGGG